MAAHLATHPSPQAAHQPGNEQVWTPARLVRSLQSQILHAVQFCRASPIWSQTLVIFPLVTVGEPSEWIESADRYQGQFFKLGATPQT